MNVNNRISYVGFLAVLATMGAAPIAEAAGQESATSAKPALHEIDSRLSRLSAALQTRAEQLQLDQTVDGDPLVARGFANRSGRGGWANGRRRGWADGRGGSFVNRNPWRNGWRDGGWRDSGWRDSSSGGWRNGGNFVNWRN